MRILVLGGTAWLGRELAARAVAAGHDVVCLARGEAGPHAPGTRLVRADRDADTGLAAVADRSWDAVLDVARRPSHVRRAVRDLRTGHYVLVSTGNVYADTLTAGQDEAGPLLPPGDENGTPEGYGAAKVACERAVLEVYEGRCTIARSGLLGGPGDPHDRAAYWPWRFAHPSGAEVLVPDAGAQATALLDVRDLASWLLRCVAETVAGVFNTTGPVTPMAEHLAVAAAVGGGTARTVPVPEDWLREHGVEHWAGRRSLPLWLPETMAGFCAHRSDRAYAAGLAPRPLSDTLSDVLLWRAGLDREWSAGLADTEERDLLGAWHADRPGGGGQR
ncbi:reductase [Marmoricola endophyticus]|uniref:Reductase n=1 Tax=Marmoricola endophyticus TaxID=2040280 RepID=A0A917EZB8_9ACTN|nr:NAD-dependent epimerase/dehydratase family protein [Marmoricola endophyticus]GGF34722.1 reductase [Marmoricola endophyticus]